MQNNDVLLSVSNNHLSQFLESDLNPLAHVHPPVVSVVKPNAVLVQAEHIRKTLADVAKSDPSARCHHFPFTVAPENRHLLEKNGYILENEGLYTKVSWSNNPREVTLIM
jgi:hypothetical protein